MDQRIPVVLGAAQTKESQICLWLPQKCIPFGLCLYVLVLKQLLNHNSSSEQSCLSPVEQ